LRKHELIVFDGVCFGKLSVLWKHGYPTKSLKLLSYGRVINFLIFRNLDDWLISMYNNPYYLKLDKNTTSFRDFLTKKQELSGEDDVPVNYINKKVLNHTDEGKTIFEIRYQKLDKYLRFFEENDDVVIVNLSYLQDRKNCTHFINSINKKYGFNMTRIWNAIPTHTKTKEINKQNRVYNTKIDDTIRSIINQSQNEDIENRIKNLTFEMK
jgi:hypothetical protein